MSCGPTWDPHIFYVPKWDLHTFYVGTFNGPTLWWAHLVGLTTYQKIISIILQLLYGKYKCILLFPYIKIITTSIYCIHL